MIIRSAPSRHAWLTIETDNPRRIIPLKRAAKPLVLQPPLQLLYLLATRSRRSTGHAGEADPHYRRVVELLNPAAATPSAAFALSALGNRYVLGGEIELGIAYSRQAVEVATRIGLVEAAAKAQQCLGLGRLWVDDAGGREDMDESIRLAKDRVSPTSVLVYFNAAETCDGFGDRESARALRDEAQQRATRLGMTRYYSDIYTDAVVQQSYDCGAWDEALVYAKDHLRAKGEETLSFEDVMSLIMEGRISIARGDIDDALMYARRARAVAPKDRPDARASALGFLARVLHAVGHKQARDEVIEEALRAWAVTPFLAWRATGDIAMVCVSVGATESFLNAAARLKIQTPWLRAAVATASRRFTEATDVYAQLGSLPDEAYARLQAGRQLIEQAQRAEGEAELEKSLAFWRRVDAAAYIREAEGLLARAASA